MDRPCQNLNLRNQVVEPPTWSSEILGAAPSEIPGEFSRTGAARARDPKFFAHGHREAPGNSKSNSRIPRPRNVGELPKGISCGLVLERMRFAHVGVDKAHV